MKELDELKAEIDALGAAWNLTGKVDRMKVLINRINNKINKEKL